MPVLTGLRDGRGLVGTAKPTPERRLPVPMRIDPLLGVAQGCESAQVCSTSATRRTGRHQHRAGSDCVSADRFEPALLAAHAGRELFVSHRVIAMVCHTEHPRHVQPLFCPHVPCPHADQPQQPNEGRLCQTEISVSPARGRQKDARGT